MQLSSTTYNTQVLYQAGAALGYQLPQLSLLIFTLVTEVRIEQFRQLLWDHPDSKLSPLRLHTWKVDLGQVIDPFYSPPIQDLICSPIELELKYGNNEMRIHENTFFIPQIH